MLFIYLRRRFAVKLSHSSGEFTHSHEGALSGEVLFVV